MFTDIVACFARWGVRNTSVREPVRARVCRLLLGLVLALSVQSTALADPGKIQNIAPGAKAATANRGPAFHRLEKGHGPSAINSEIMPAVVGFTAANVCFTYAYDHNGNRTSLTVLPYDQTATWGSAPYGCFAWTAP